MSASNACTAFLGTIPVADITRLDGCSFMLEYRNSWTGSPLGFPLSPCLPFTKTNDHDASYAFFENMLPEGQALEILSQKTASSGNMCSIWR